MNTKQKLYSKEMTNWIAENVVPKIGNLPITEWTNLLNQFTEQFNTNGSINMVQFQSKATYIRMKKRGTIGSKKKKADVPEVFDASKFAELAETAQHGVSVLTQGYAQKLEAFRNRIKGEIDKFIDNMTKELSNIKLKYGLAMEPSILEIAKLKRAKLSAENAERIVKEELELYKEEVERLESELAKQKPRFITQGVING